MFTDALEINLEITPAQGGNGVKIPGANVRAFRLEVHSYGFTCETDFVVSLEKETDTLFDTFVKKDLLSVVFKISPHLKPADADPDPLTLQGLVTFKAILLERTAENVHLQSNPVLYRLYRISFSDSAQAIWRQHYPYDLFVGKAFKDVLDAHKGDKISLKYDWDPLNTQFPIITVPAGRDAGGGSFYDFVMWYVFQQNGVWTYDTMQNSYTISGAKDAQGSAQSLDRLDIEECRADFPETIRFNLNVLNGYSEDPKRQEVEQDQAVPGVHQDCLDRYPIAADFQDRQSLETQRLFAREHELHLAFQRFPCITYRPGTLVQVQGGLWSDRIFQHGKTYRVRSVRIDGQATDPEVTADHNLSFTRYDLNMESQLETQAEKWVALPSFQPPRFPVKVEGKIVSEQGDEKAETYQIYQDADTSQDQYKVTIPLFNNQQVVVPFEPNLLEGHFYFPVYKGARVLVDLFFHQAGINRFLDWRPEARLPAETQGNQIIMGKTSSSNTALSHTYVDEKPVFKVYRTSDKDTEMITLSEGSLVLQTKDEDSA
jgi:hypothetical protein